MQPLDIKDKEIERLVVASQKGSSDAFAKIYDLFINPIYRYMYFRVGAADAEDLTELVFLKTWEHIKRYQSGRNKFSSWLFRIAHNVVIDHYRANKFEGELEEKFQDFRKEANSTARANDSFDQELLGKAMKELRGPYRQILVLKYINDLSNEEIGNIIGKSQTALRILQFRALRSLRRVLESMGVTEENV